MAIVGLDDQHAYVTLPPNDELAVGDFLGSEISHPCTAFSREELLQQVWGWSFGDQSTVTVHVRRLREKVEVDPTMPERLVTVWGVGYRWEPR